MKLGLRARPYLVYAKYLIGQTYEAKDKSRDVKSCQIRHPEVQIRYPDTSERSHRIASYVIVNVCMVYFRPYCSIYDFFLNDNGKASAVTQK